MAGGRFTGNIKGRKDAARHIKWMLTRKSAAEAGQPGKTERQVPSYGDLTFLNTSRLILDSVGIPLLSDIAGDLMDLLGTSCAVYEKNGDYALGIFSSHWCQFMDQASRRRCDTPDNREALESGKWHCHESCWNEAARRSIETKGPVDVACRGGIRLFAVPICTGNETIGSLSVGYGDPPCDPATLGELATVYGVSVKDLRLQAEAYDLRPPFIVELAKKRILSSARFIGEIVARKEAEQALRQSEEKFRSLVEATSDWVWEVDKTGIYTYASPKIRDLLGYEPEEALGKTAFDFMPPAERERVARIFQEAIQSKAPLNSIENTNIHKSGQKVDLETSAVPIVDADGNLLGYRGIDRDITKRKQAEAALRDSRHMLQTVLDSIPAGVFWKNRDLSYLGGNRTWLASAGLNSSEEVVGKSDYELPWDKTQADSFREADRRVMESGIPKYDVIEAYIRSDGTHAWAKTNKVPLRDKDGNIVGVLGTYEDLTERKRAEAALAESEKRFSVFMEHLPACVFIKDQTGRLLFANRYLEEFFGWRECIGKTTEELLPKEVAERMISDDRKVLAEGPMVVQERITDLHGAEHFFDTYKFPIEVEGSAALLAGIAVDITERKRDEEALEKRIMALTRPLDDVKGIAFEDLFNLPDLQRLQDLFADVWGVAALIAHPDGTPITRPSNSTFFCSEIIRKNPKGLGNCRLSDAMIGRHNPSGPIIQPCLGAGLCNAGASITVGGRHIASWLIGQVRSQAQSEGQIMEYARDLGADETAFREAFRKLPPMPQEKFEQIAHALFALANQLSTAAYQNVQQARFIAERKQAEEALRDSEARYSAVVQQAKDGVIIIQDNILQFVNQPLADILGYAPGEMENTPYLNYVVPESRAMIAERVKERLVGKDVPQVYETKLLHKDGTIIDVELSASVIQYRGKAGAVSIIRDISDRKRMEEERRRFDVQMREVQKLESLGVLAGGIAHDFNNLLMAILGNADLALLALSPVSPAHQYVEEITRASQRAADLCRQMLAYSGKGRFVVSRHDISEIVREMGQILDVSVSKKATMRYVLAEGLPAVQSDATQIRQVIMNLITNASDALDDTSGIITVTTGVMECSESYLSESYLDDGLPGGTYVYLEVLDTGCGMDAETRSRIFDPFFTTKFTGRGLGLAAVLGIVRSHKGAIRVYSEVGEGTTVKILLPAAEWGPAETVKTAEQGVSLQGGGTVLLVDDDSFVRSVASEMLARLGFQVLTAVNGREALKIFETHGAEIACVILDLTMPEMGGEETFRELRKFRSDVRVILSSGYNEQDVTQRFVGRRLTGFIQKPYTVANLRGALNRALG